MTAIPIPLSTSPATHPQESAGQLINCFAEPLGDGARSPVKWRRSPGLVNFGTSVRTGCRGLFENNNVLYGAFSGQMVQWTSVGGAATNVGALTGTSKGFFFRNNKTPPDQWFVDPDQGVWTFVNSPPSVTPYAPAGLPAVNSGCIFDGYGIFATGKGQMYSTGLNSTSFNSLHTVTAESNPDGLLRVIPYGQRLLAFGTRTIETWTNAALAQFPLERGVIIPRGLGGRYAIAGHEDGFTRALLFVGDDNAVYRLDGYNLEKVSPPYLDGLIAAVSDKNLLEACCYVIDGHGFWQLSSSTWTWVFNTNSSTWHERQSHQSTRSRITTSHQAFNKWLVGDTATGNVHYLTTDTQVEVTSPFRMRVESGPVNSFPARMRVKRADFDFTTGVGIATGTHPIQTQPQVEISWSDDGGLTWGYTLLRDLGEQKKGDHNIVILRAGMTTNKGRRWRLDVADPVPLSLMGGQQMEDLRQ